MRIGDIVITAARTKLIVHRNRLDAPHLVIIDGKNSGQTYGKPVFVADPIHITKDEFIKMLDGGDEYFINAIKQAFPAVANTETYYIPAGK